MSSSSLQSASSYLNNLLLARGLLTDGKSIDFASPTDVTGDPDPTMSRVINLVHDLVLRRDRDSDHREALANSIRNMRVDESQRVLDLQRAQSKNVDLTRNLTTMEAQTRSLQASVRKAELQARELKEQMLKMKSTLDQVRAKCISDVRKRDTEVEKLKGHIMGLQRGKREATGMKINVINPLPRNAKEQEQGAGQDASGDDFNLEQETNDFLAALVNETSTENVVLRNVVDSTITTLKELTGLTSEEGVEEEADVIGIPGQYRKSRQQAQQRSQEAALVSCESLAANMTAVLEHCQSILKDPSFVPIEELHIRDEEIIKLREGWEKMAGRWKEAVTLMDTWRRRMLEDGKLVRIDDLTNLGFGRSIATLPNGQPVLGQEQDELSSMLFNDSRSEANRSSLDAEDDVKDLEMPQSGSDEESDLEIPPEPEPKRLAASPARRGLKLPRPTYALGEINGNATHYQPQRRNVTAQSADSGVGGLDGSVDSEVEDELLKDLPRSRIPRQVSNIKLHAVPLANK